MRNWQLLSSILIGMAFVASVGWLAWWTLRRSEDPALLIVKWVLTAICVSVLAFVIGPIVATGGMGGAFVGIPATAAVGLVLAIIWRKNIAMLVAGPVSSLYDGGHEPPDPKPVYSVALAKRKRGEYLGARDAVREQLVKFPTDLEGQLLLAEIEAKDLNDLQAASVVVERFVTQPGHAAANIVFALNSMADWHLQVGRDRESARACFERIIELLPGSEWEMRARQRIAHLATLEQLLGGKRNLPIHVPHIEGDPGLDGGRSIAKPVEEEGGAQAARFVKHLEVFPHDTEVREQLARLYGEHFHRLDLATDQLEQLIQYPNQPQRQVVRWLNMLADFQVQFGGTYPAARSALERIVQLYPQAGAANLAQNRIELLKLEFKGKEKSQTVTPGSYEDDIGLKRGLPHQL